MSAGELSAFAAGCVLASGAGCAIRGNRVWALLSFVLGALNLAFVFAP